ncbi:WXG100 family type VII secretion target [Actinoallomurus iriomotensis]|uniref:WXG100 family type VII secretion target n=1 Tax=Actinoallomurus iriomotensis TaxID=478107 RepID=A0A9W6RQK1_9ACTN|nr:WXG100 family type VII secretion target [Actinoallomurus iriomotensis]GLY80029.1 hypothetical protein Airi01_082960 [Actinoallomurus iriomotensis]
MADIDGSDIYVGEGLGAAGGVINARAGQIAGELEALKSKLAPLQDAWNKSQAADYYQGLQQEWNIAAEGLFGPEGVLGEIAQAMNVNWGNYTDAEWANIQTWKH